MSEEVRGESQKGRQDEWEEGRFKVQSIRDGREEGWREKDKRGGGRGGRGLRREERMGKRREFGGLEIAEIREGKVIVLSEVG